MISIIVARSKNNAIGKNGNIPWKIEGEQKQFRELTTGNVVIMGRRTYEDIGHPLPNRMNVVVSSSVGYEGENLATAKSLNEALDIAEKCDMNISKKCGSTIAREREVFIAGGYRLFEEALPIVDKMYITEVDTLVEDADTFFPEFDKNQFEIITGETISAKIMSGDCDNKGNKDNKDNKDNKINFTRTVYIRKDKI